jgi:hypothetical protein
LQRRHREFAALRQRAGPDLSIARRKAIVNLSSALGQDLQSASIKVGRALQDPIKGMQALDPAGDHFHHRAKRTGQGAGAERPGHAKAQQIILARPRKRFDGAAKALRDATPGAELKNAWEDFGETDRRAAGAGDPRAGERCCPRR